MMTDSQREMVIAEAKRWIGTPFHHEAKVLGAGVDCAQLLVAVYGDTGIIPEIVVPRYTFQEALHRSEERYIQEIEKYADEVEQGGPGDVVIWKLTRRHSHAAIIIEWPKIIHAWVGRGVTGDNAEFNGKLIGKPHKFYTARNIPE